MKIVTKRSGKPNLIQDTAILLKTIGQLRGPALVPKGVYRFSSMEEANEWMITQMARTRARQSSKI